MSYEITVGTCSLCGGRVALSRLWMSTEPQLPRCTSCGAYPEKPFGAVIPMKKRDSSELNSLCQLLGDESRRKLTNICQGKISYISSYNKVKSE